MSNIGSNFWFCVSNVHPMIIIEIQFGGDGNHLRFQIGNKNKYGSRISKTHFEIFVLICFMKICENNNLKTFSP
jgi:hypothetical protein